MKLGTLLIASAVLYIGVSILYRGDHVPARTALWAADLPAPVREVPVQGPPSLKLCAFAVTGVALVVLLAVFIRSQCRPVPWNEDDRNPHKRSC